QADSDLVEQVDDRAHAVGGRRDRGGGHADDARAPAHPPDHQLQRSRSGGHARRGAQRGARRKEAGWDIQLGRLRGTERLARAGAGAGVMSEVATKRRALVTGGGRGLGSAIVRALAASGHDVVFTYRSATSEADALVKELAAAYPGSSVAGR